MTPDGDDDIAAPKSRASPQRRADQNNMDRHDDDHSSISRGDGDDESTLANEPSNQKAALAKADRETLARGETRAIRALRIVTLLVLVGTAVLVSLAIYYFASTSQQNSFTSEFQAYSIRVLESFHTGIARQMGAFDALSASITSHAIESGSTFPKVTFPNWEVLANNFQIQAQATYVQYMPLVTDQGREEWEEYADEAKEYLMWSYLNQDRLRKEQDAKYGYDGISNTSEASSSPESAQKQNEEEGGQSRNLQSLQVQHAGNFSRSIWGTSGNGLPEEPGTGPYLPIWHQGPTIPVIELLNMNGMDLVFYTGPASVVLSTGQASLGIMSDFDDPNDEMSAIVMLFNAALQLGPYRHELEKFIGDPITNLAYPVFDRFSSSSQQVAGVLMTGLYWRLLFQDLLPPSARGITVVLTNSLGQAETFTINGAEAIYAGNGDLHETKYESMANSAEIIEYLTNSAGPQTRSFTAADLSPAFVTYNISVYPSSESEAQYVNSEPIWYALAVAGIFLFTTSIFLLCNFIVERRQKLVLDRAVKSSAVVRSLFPANVEQRLYEDVEGQLDSSQHQGNGVEKWSNDGFNTRRLSKFLETGIVGPKKGKPIADLFPEATVFFADLAGFTKWSSEREPSEVFGLLETIYSSFDLLASKRGVFKVEAS
jgi:hypothetical protein